MADAAARHAAMWPTVRDQILGWRRLHNVTTGLPPIPAMMLNLTGLGFTAPRGGPISYRTVQELLARYEADIDKLQYQSGMARQLPSGGAEITMLSHVRLREHHPPHPRGALGMVIEIKPGGMLAIWLGTLERGGMAVLPASEVESAGY